MGVLTENPLIKSLTNTLGDAFSFYEVVFLPLAQTEASQKGIRRQKERKLEEQKEQLKITCFEQIQKNKYQKEIFVKINDMLHNIESLSLRIKNIFLQSAGF